MDLEFLKRGAKQFAYQLSKFFPEEESLINHYVCKENVIVHSTKKLYIYYFDRFIDYVGDDLRKVFISEIDEESGYCLASIKGKTYSLQFDNAKDFKSMLFYYEKYKD